MFRSPLTRWLPLVAFLLVGCSEGGPTAPIADFDLDGTSPLATVLPDLAPDPGTAGTERYVPTLERILRTSVRMVREKHGDDAAGKVVAQATALRTQIRTAREAQDEAALKAAVRALEVYSARVGLRVFGERLARHVVGDASKKLQGVTDTLRAMQESGQDVGRLVAAARTAHRHLAAARDAWDAERPALAMVHAAEALDLANRIAAAF